MWRIQFRIFKSDESFWKSAFLSRNLWKTEFILPFQHPWGMHREWGSWVLPGCSWGHTWPLPTIKCLTATFSFSNPYYYCINNSNKLEKNYEIPKKSKWRIEKIFRKLFIKFEESLLKICGISKLTWRMFESKSFRIMTK